MAPPAGMDGYTRSIMTRIVGNILREIGYSSSSSVAVDILRDVAHLYLKKVCVQLRNCGDHKGSEFVDEHDVGTLLHAMNTSVDELMCYMRNVDPMPLKLKKNVPLYPVNIRSRLNFLKPGSREVLTRPVHVHEHLPPMRPEEENEDHNITGKRPSASSATPLLLETSSTENETSNAAEPSAPSESTESSKKDESHMLFKPRDLSSLVMTTSGFISHGKAGKYPEVIVSDDEQPLEGEEEGEEKEKEVEEEQEKVEKKETEEEKYEKENVEEQEEEEKEEGDKKVDQKEGVKEGQEKEEEEKEEKATTSKEFVTTMTTVLRQQINDVPKKKLQQQLQQQQLQLQQQQNPLPYQQQQSKKTKEHSHRRHHHHHHRHHKKKNSVKPGRKVIEAAPGRRTLAEVLMKSVQSLRGELADDEAERLQTPNRPKSRKEGAVGPSTAPAKVEPATAPVIASSDDDEDDKYPKQNKLSIFRKIKCVREKSYGRFPPRGGCLVTMKKQQDLEREEELREALAQQKELALRGMGRDDSEEGFKRFRRRPYDEDEEAMFGAKGASDEDRGSQNLLVDKDSPVAHTPLLSDIGIKSLRLNMKKISAKFEKKYPSKSAYKSPMDGKRNKASARDSSPDLLPPVLKKYADYSEESSNTDYSSGEEFTTRRYPKKKIIPPFKTPGKRGRPRKYPRTDIPRTQVKRTTNNRGLQRKSPLDSLEESICQQETALSSTDDEWAAPKIVSKKRDPIPVPDSKPKSKRGRPRKHPRLAVGRPRKNPLPPVPQDANTEVSASGSEPVSKFKNQQIPGKSRRGRPRKHPLVPRVVPTQNAEEEKEELPKLSSDEKWILNSEEKEDTDSEVVLESVEESAECKKAIEKRDESVALIPPKRKRGRPKKIHTDEGNIVVAAVTPASKKPAESAFVSFCTVDVLSESDEELDKYLDRDDEKDDDFHLKKSTKRRSKAAKKRGRPKKVPDSIQLASTLNAASAKQQPVEWWKKRAITVSSLKQGNENKKSSVDEIGKEWNKARAKIASRGGKRISRSRSTSSSGSNGSIGRSSSSRRSRSSTSGGDNSSVRSSSCGSDQGGKKDFMALRRKQKLSSIGSSVSTYKNGDDLPPMLPLALVPPPSRPGLIPDILPYSPYYQGPKLNDIPLYPMYPSLPPLPPPRSLAPLPPLKNLSSPRTTPILSACIPASSLPPSRRENVRHDSDDDHHDRLAHTHGGDTTFPRNKSPSECHPEDEDLRKKREEKRSRKEWKRLKKEKHEKEKKKKKKKKEKEKEKHKKKDRKHKHKREEKHKKKHKHKHSKKRKHRHSTSNPPKLNYLENDEATAVPREEAEATAVGERHKLEDQHDYMPAKSSAETSSAVHSAKVTHSEDDSDAPTDAFKEDLQEDVIEETVWCAKRKRKNGKKKKKVPKLAEAEQDLENENSDVSDKKEIEESLPSTSGMSSSKKGTTSTGGAKRGRKRKRPQLLTKKTKRAKPVLELSGAEHFHLLDEDGNEIWVCPGCGKEDDGTPMLGCDGCDAWYHWHCLGIIRAPGTRKWYCAPCKSRGVGD